MSLPTARLAVLVLLGLATAAAARNAAPGKYTAAAGSEKRLKICVRSGGPMMELRL